MSGYTRSQRPRQAILGQLPRIHRADGSPIRVLLVDDEPALTNLVKMALHYEGWDVEVAHDGQEAIAKFDKVGPDVLVLDIMLPDVDGLEILRRVRESDVYTPTLFLTARDSVMDRVTGLTSGADDYMTKRRSASRSWSPGCAGCCAAPAIWKGPPMRHSGSETLRSTGPAGR